jgi:hypothetical protein
MWPVKLRPGVTSDEFEQYLKEDWVEVLWSAPGVKSYVLKANRGIDVGRYVIVAEYDRVHTRDLYYPSGNEESDLWKQLSAQGLATPESTRAEARWAELVVPEWADWDTDWELVAE